MRPYHLADRQSIRSGHVSCPRYCIKIHRLQLPIAIADDYDIVKIDGHGIQLYRCASGAEEAQRCADDLDYGTRATGNFMRQLSKVIVA